MFPTEVDHRSTDSEFSVWTAILSQETASSGLWQLKVAPPRGQGRDRTFSVDSQQVEFLGIAHCSKAMRTTNSDESGSCVKLYFGSKALSVKKSDFFIESEETRMLHRQCMVPP